MTERRRRLTPSLAAIAVAGGGILMAAVVALAAEAAHDENEDRILRRRTREAAAVIEASIPGIETPLATSAAVAEVTSGNSNAGLREALTTLVAPTGSFASASVWPVDAMAPTEVVGEPVALVDEPPAEIRRFFDRVVRTDELSVLDLLGHQPPRLGFSATPPGDAGFVVYAELVLPADRRSTVEEDSSFSGLDFAMYLDEERPSALIGTTTTDLPIGGRRAERTIDFGDSSLQLVMTPTEELGGQLTAWLPAIVLGTGSATALAAGLLTERLQRRRRHAEELAQENARLYAEQRDASVLLQQSLLPPSLPDIDGVDVAVRYAAGVEGTHVGGDWYDVVDRGDSFVMIVGDVSGRGLTAASVMARIRHTVRTLAAQGLPPDRILAETNRFGADHREGHFATVVCGSADKATGTLTFASAGHPRPLVVSDGDASWVDVPIGPPLGVVRPSDYRTATATAGPGTTVLLVTDGLYERRGEVIDAGLERLRTTAATSDDGSLEAMVDHVVDAMTGGAAADDAAVLALRWRA